MIQLKPHQRKAVDEMHNGCILCGGVGVGKTLTALAYYIEKECNGTLGDYSSLSGAKDLYVITTAKKRDALDWQGDGAKLGLSINDPDHSAAHIKFVVDSWNNIGKYEDVKDAFFIFDEQRVVGSGAWVKSFIKIAKQNRWILLSATPGDTWLDYIPVFVANGWYKNRTEFKRRHVIYSYYGRFPKVERYIEVGRLVRLRNQVLVDMPYERHTTRETIVEVVKYDHDLMRKVLKERWHVYENRPLRDASELFSVMRKVVNSDESRLRSMRELMERHPKVIVFYNFDYELEMLRTLASSTSPRATESMSEIEKPEKSTRVTPTTNRSSSLRRLSSSDFDGSQSLAKVNTTSCSDLPFGLKGKIDQTSTSISVAEWNGHKHEEIPKTDRWMYLVQYAAGAEGWNCIDTDTVVFFSLTYSYKHFHQAHGRIDRLNTPFEKLKYYVLKSDSAIDKAIWKALRAKKSFNEGDFGVKK